MAGALVAIFNDIDANNSESLANEIATLEGITKLAFKPQVYNLEVGTEIVEALEKSKLVPTLCFVDPWGYKGLSLRLINSILKDWACECIFFFNYNRINMGVNNDTVKQHMDALFGEERSEQLRQQIAPLSSEERELAIVEALSQALVEMGGKFVLPFCFKNSAGVRTSHHLIFVSKNVLGYSIMKDIMAKESSSAWEGVPSFDYNPATERQPFLFSLSQPMEELAKMLVYEFAGQQLTMLDIYEKHHIGRRYIKANYKRALIELESQGKISANPPMDKRRKPKGEMTFSDAIVVTFPKSK
jgi:three-Cys-motif partner protein